MFNQYIIKFSNNQYKEPIYAFAKVYKTDTNVPVLSVNTCDSCSNKNISLLYQIITNNINSLNFDDKKMEFNLNDSKITFDKNSPSAYTQFKDLVIDYVNIKFESILYPSGNVYYVGEVITKDDEKLPHGQGFMYYDTSDYKLQYSGEFENGLFDGAGIFYNKTGNISLKANNISNNIPTQKGKLEVKFKNRNKTFDVDFFESWEDLEVYDNSTITELIKSEKFLEKLADIFCDFENNETLQDLQFEWKTTDDKLVEIRKQLKQVTLDIEDKYDDLMRIIRFNNVNMFIMEIIMSIFISIIINKN
jgi:hypothetical protein